VLFPNGVLDSQTYIGIYILNKINNLQIDHTVYFSPKEKENVLLDFAALLKML
jgi:hypothetical protein